MSAERIVVSFVNDVMFSPPPLSARTLYERVKAALAEEREACARVAETANGLTRADVAAAIRHRT